MGRDPIRRRPTPHGLNIVIIIIIDRLTFVEEIRNGLGTEINCHAAIDPSP